MCVFSRFREYAKKTDLDIVGTMSVKRSLLS